MPRKPLTEEDRQRLRDNLARGRQTAAINREARKAGKGAATAVPPTVPAVDIEALVQAAVAKAVAETKQAAQPDSLQQIMSQLAIAIGNYQNQFSGQQLIPAEVLAEREHFGKELKSAIAELLQKIDAGEEVEWPRYQLVAKTYLPLANGDEIIEPVRRGADNMIYPTEIDWPMAPNLTMRPINGPAEHIYALFRGWIGNQGPHEKVRDKAVVNGQAIDKARPTLQDEQYIVTHGGRVVTAGSATQRKHNQISTPEMAQAFLQHRGGRIVGQDPMRVHSGPPTKQVRVLGTIAHPAVQNG